MVSKINYSWPVFFLALILLTTGILMFEAAREDSVIVDELAHIPAGYSYIKFLDYRLNPEHPPLLKAFSTIPLLGLNLSFKTDSPAWASDVNGQWDVGDQFLYESGNNADQIIKTARIFPIILTLITTASIYFLSKELLGKWWALTPAFLFGFSPTVIAHGHYVTTDIAATAGFIFSIYFFLKYLSKPSHKSLITTGLVLGFAELTKFSLVLLIPYFFIILFIFRLINKSELTKRLWGLLLIFVIALGVIWIIYFFFTLKYPPQKQIADTTHILNSFKNKAIANFVITLTLTDFTRPIAHYFLGILMVLQRTAWGNTNYFLGEVSNLGSILYFPLVFFAKEPIPSLLLIATAFTIGTTKIIKNYLNKFSSIKDYLRINFTEFSMIIFIIIYWSYSLKSPLNIGFRHILPTLPFIYILITKTIRNFKLPKRDIFLGFMIVWYFIETIFTTPYFLSYFNQFAGGTKNGYRYVTDSNYDWGQDLKRLAEFIKNYNGCADLTCPSTIQINQPIKKIAIDYFGRGNPEYYLGDIAEEWSSKRSNPKNQNIEWLAVSINILEEVFAKSKTEQTKKSESDYLWLRNLRPPRQGIGQVPEPDFRAGTSIFIYHL